MIAENLQHVRQTIAEACTRAGRDPATVTLICVSKTHPPSAVLEAVAAGAQHFGENRVEEAEVKIPAVVALTDQPLTWHMIGHVQSRKARDAARLFAVVHSVDSLKLAMKLGAAAENLRQTLDILLEVNISGEEAKYGLRAVGWAESQSTWQEVRDQVKAISEAPGIRVQGLMTMAPIVEDMEHTRPIFRGLARLRDALQGELGIRLPELSMGMTDDYPIAIEEGATVVRVGRAIFGERA